VANLDEVWGARCGCACEKTGEGWRGRHRVVLIVVELVLVIVDALYPAYGIPIEGPTLEDAKAERAAGFDHAPAVWEHLY
jgi:hypothetical protein